MHFLPSVATRAKHHTLRADHTARRLYVVNTVDGRQTLNRTCRVYFHTHGARFAHDAERELERVNADTLLFQHGTEMFTLIAVTLTHFFRTQNFCLIAEVIVTHLCHVAQVCHLRWLVGHVQMTAVKGFTFNVFGELLEVVKTTPDFGVQALRRIHSPTLDPLRTRQTTAGILTLPTAAA